MVDRIKACVAARSDPSFVIMARTDAYANEGTWYSIERVVTFSIFLFRRNGRSACESQSIHWRRRRYAIPRGPHKVVRLRAVYKGLPQHAWYQLLFIFSIIAIYSTTIFGSYSPPLYPVLANITEWGKTDLFTTAELGSAGVGLALYPLSAFRAMSAAALQVYKTILNDGTQKNVVRVCVCVRVSEWM